MTLQFSTTSAEIKNSGLKVILYGGSGHGKTILSSTAPQPLIASKEGGLLSLAADNIEKVFAGQSGITTDIPVVVIQTVDDISALYEWCKEPDNHKYFKTLIIDSISDIAETILENFKKGSSKAGNAVHGQQAYGAVLEKTLEVIKLFRDIKGIDVVFICKAEMVKDELTGIAYVGPSFPGRRLNSATPYLVDEVWYLGIDKDADGNTFRYIQTQPDLKYTAKSRSGKLDEREFPHLGYLFNKAKGEQL